MKFSFVTALTALLGVAGATLVTRQDSASDKKVFAHYMVGITYGQTAAQWLQDIKDAKKSGIDAFVLNCGPPNTDFHTETQLDIAYEQARLETGFKLFLSFDMAGDRWKSWSVAYVSQLINKYRVLPAQLKVNGKPFVSTFEGPDWVDNWAGVRSAVPGGIYLVPDWSSIGVPGLKDRGFLGKSDGAFSWDAWAKDGGRKSTSSDIAYQNMLSGTGKSYMMGVAPYFYTDVDAYNKHWLWSSDQLWFDRWEQVIQLNPNFVEIITWNDYGESSYIGSSNPPASIEADIHRYVDLVPHGAIRDVLPYYIKSYKAGRKLPIENEVAIFWYRQNAKALGSKGQVKCQVGAELRDPTTCVADEVFVLVHAKAAGTVKVAIGSYSRDIAIVAGTQLVSLPFAGNTGVVKVTLNGAEGQGPTPITNTIPGSGKHNFNYFTSSTKPWWVDFPST